MKRIKNSIFLYTAIIILISIIIFLSYIESASYKQKIETKTTELENTLKYLDSYAYDYENLKEYSSDYAVRLTLIAADGVVLYDTNEDPSLIDNHINRVEVKNAKSDITASSLRYSNTKKEDYLYVAKQLYTNDYLRASVPISKFIILKLPIRQREFILHFTALILIIVLVSLYLIRYINRPIEELNEVAIEYRKGNLEAKCNIVGPKELEVLGNTLNTMSSNLIDITNRLEQQTQVYETMLKSLDISVILISRNKLIVEANKSALNLFHSDLKECFITTLITDIEFSNLISISFLEQKSKSIQLVLFEETLNPKTVNIKLGYVDENYLLVSIEDISEIVRLENTRKDFVANVSHELKTPLTNILGFNEVLLEEYNRKFVENIGSQANYMKDIIDDLLLLATLEQANYKIKRDYYYTNNIVDEVKNRINNDLVEYEINIDTIYCNDSLLILAITNLITNALKYNDKENPSVKVSFHQEEDYIISVEDNGQGIASSQINRIFERFYRIDTSRSLKGSTGLGLSIVKHIVELHKGKVEVKSILTKGSIFYLRLGSKSDLFKESRNHLYQI